MRKFLARPSSFGPPSAAVQAEVHNDDAMINMDQFEQEMEASVEELTEERRGYLEDLAARVAVTDRLRPEDAPSTGRYPDDNPKTVFGMVKPSTAAIPPIAILQLAQAMTNGAEKYGRFNWRDNTVTTSVYTDAIDRHLLAFRDGENFDRESGLHHLAHVMACCAIILDANSVSKLNDDRRLENRASDYIRRATTLAIVAKTMPKM